LRRGAAFVILLTQPFQVLRMIAQDPAAFRRADLSFRRAEGPTLALLAACYGVWALSTAFADGLGLWLAWPLLTLAITLHSSLQHEVLHGHPTASATLNHALVFPAVGLFVPYERFRDLHLEHHRDENLTDPYDDPESNYLDPAVWARLSPWTQAVLRANNTLLGRMLLGPAVSLRAFWGGDLRAMLKGDRVVAQAYALHLAGLVPVALWLGTVSTMSWPAYLLAAYSGFSILKIRTFLEHRAHEKVPGRTVIVEDRGPLALLFLNNNFHAVHHAHPRLPWHLLPGLYRARREEWLARNRAYRYDSYAEIFRRYSLTAKDPVPHPLMKG
jgi:fatty acid desaturase